MRQECAHRSPRCPAVWPPAEITCVAAVPADQCVRQSCQLRRRQSVYLIPLTERWYHDSDCSHSKAGGPRDRAALHGTPLLCLAMVSGSWLQRGGRSTCLSNVFVGYLRPSKLVRGLGSGSVISLPSLTECRRVGGGGTWPRATSPRSWFVPHQPAKRHMMQGMGAYALWREEYQVEPSYPLVLYAILLATGANVSAHVDR